MHHLIELSLSFQKNVKSLKLDDPNWSYCLSKIGLLNHNCPVTVVLIAIQYHVIIMWLMCLLSCDYLIGCYSCWFWCWYCCVGSWSWEDHLSQDSLPGTVRSTAISYIIVIKIIISLSLKNLFYYYYIIGVII